MNLEPTLDIDSLKDPEQFFLAFERLEGHLCIFCCCCCSCCCIGRIAHDMMIVVQMLKKKWQSRQVVFQLVRINPEHQWLHAIVDLECLGKINFYFLVI